MSTVSEKTGHRIEAADRLGSVRKTAGGRWRPPEIPPAHLAHAPAGKGRCSIKPTVWPGRAAANVAKLGLQLEEKLRGERRSIDADRVAEALSRKLGAHDRVDLIGDVTHEVGDERLDLVRRPRHRGR